MAKLVIQAAGTPDRVVEIRPGPRRIGRAPENDIVLSHASVSAEHCVVELYNEGLLVRDLGSTNGTDVDGQPILEALAESGQVIQVGIFNCRVEELAPNVSIPTWKEEPPPPLPAGVKPCANHPEYPASMECLHCHKLFCGVCIHLMRRQGGVLHKLCPICSHHCVPLEGMNKAERPGKLIGLLKRMIPKSNTMRLHRGRRRFH